MRSPIIYYGGKSSMLKHILPLIPVHNVYTESFCGGAAVLFAKEPVHNETINDRLDLVVNFYEQLKKHYNRLNKEIQASLISRIQHNKALYIIRHKNNKSITKIQLAWAFWMCSNYSYGNKIGGG
jgi:DNA adenine methylase